MTSFEGKPYPCFAKYSFLPSEEPENIHPFHRGLAEVIADSMKGRGPAFAQSLVNSDWKLYFHTEHFDDPDKELGRSEEVFHQTMSAIGLAMSAHILSSVVICSIRDPDGLYSKRILQHNIPDNVVPFRQI